MKSSIIEDLRDYLKGLEEFHRAKERKIRDEINILEKEKGIKCYTIGTSNLGHDRTLHTVQTEASIEDLLYIDHKYGMKYRHESTTIEQMKAGAKEEGFNFFVTHSEVSQKHDVKLDYFCNYGNY